jgi:murein L,D-transpeptidase YcbB/YkuD
MVRARLAQANESESLTAKGEEELQAILQNQRLSDLQWPDFSNHAASVKKFYEESDYKLTWTHGGKPTPEALELIQILEEAEQKGLNAIDYDGLRWHDRVTSLETKGAESESARVKFDVALTVSATRYISDLHLGRVDPESLHKDFDPEREPHDPGSFLRKDVVGAHSVKDALAQLECPYAGYQRDLLALQKYLHMAKQEVRDPIPQVQKPVEPGQTYPALGKLVRRLQFLGDVPVSKAAAESGIYSQEIADGVKRFQSSHGMDPDGRLGELTIAEMNQPIAHRVEQLRLSLERWRWLPHNFDQLPVVVNIPEFTLRAGTVGKPEVRMSVVVGKAMRSETPVLEEDMKYLVFWPYWNVPPSILRGEMIPKIAKDPAYLRKNGYEIAAHSGEVVTDDVVSDETLSQLRSGELMIRQKPGPKNALGLVKFIFPNDNNVYLHSTPSQVLFSKSRRDFSHGCIRVEDPEALAVWVLRNNAGWTRERVAQAFAAGTQQQVNLARPIPVLIVYATAVAEEDGRVLFLSDIYGHDKSLAKLEAQAYSSQD